MKENITSQPIEALYEKFMKNDSLRKVWEYFVTDFIPKHADRAARNVCNELFTYTDEQFKFLTARLAEYKEKREDQPPIVKEGFPGTRFYEIHTLS